MKNPKDYITCERIKTPRGTFALVNMTAEEMSTAGFGYHHNSDDGRYYIMSDGMIAFTVTNK